MRIKLAPIRKYEQGPCKEHFQFLTVVLYQIVHFLNHPIKFSTYPVGRMDLQNFKTTMKHLITLNSNFWFLMTSQIIFYF